MNSSYFAVTLLPFQIGSTFRVIFSLFRSRIAKPATTITTITLVL